jgi:Zinc finger, C2H2 type
MELSAPSTRASIPPIPNRAQRPARNNLEEFPSQIPETQGLGIYEYRMLHALGDHDGSIQSLPPSTTTAPEFSDSYINPRQSSQSSPNILSAEYDPFAPFHSDMGSSYASALFSRRSTEMSLPPGSPSLSVIASQRSSFSSAPGSETYSHPDPYPTFYPPVKMENNLQWTSDSNASLSITAPQTDSSILANSSSPYSVVLEDTFFNEPGGAGWPKVETLEGPNSHATISHTTVNDIFPHQKTDRKGPSGSIVRTKPPRNKTTIANANFQCKVCGKLFSRSYNYKAHMETHDSSRVYPFPCPLPDCSKKFVRKTDLQRHHQSVHMKERNFQCDFCSRYFARKDTLRRYVSSQIMMILVINNHRHMEDGCSKRFDVALGYNQYSGAVQQEQKNLPRPASMQSSYSSTATMYPATMGQHSSTLPATYSNRVGFRGNEDAQSPLWSN